MIDSKYDAIIVGGGIQGAGIAYQLAKAGERVLIIDKNRFGSGTSSKSSKLIHGGLRYLKSGQINLVRECLKDQQWMLKEFHDFVELTEFTLPVYQNSEYKPWQIRIALSIYALLAGLNPSHYFKQIHQSEINDSSFAMKKAGLTALFTYKDARTNDQDLTLEVIRRAQNYGCDVLENALIEGTRPLSAGQSLRIQHLGNCYTTRADQVIWATGPWLANKRDFSFKLDLVKGSHLCIEPALDEHCYYLESPDDGRPFFVLPWKGKTLIGTTESTISRAGLDKVSVSDDERHYLRKAFGFYFPQHRYCISNEFAGVRVLQKSNQGFNQASRELFLHHEGREIFVAGGKLSNWPSSSKKVLQCYMNNKTNAYTQNNLPKFSSEELQHARVS